MSTVNFEALAAYNDDLGHAGREKITAEQIEEIVTDVFQHSLAEHLFHF